MREEKAPNSESTSNIENPYLHTADDITINCIVERTHLKDGEKKSSIHICKWNIIKDNPEPILSNYEIPK